MPRRQRRGNAQDSNSSKQNDHAISTRIQVTFKKIIAALQDQRDLRCDLSSTRTRALLLDSEYVVLHSEYERSLAARDKLEALSRELTRQNKTIDEESENRVMEEKRLREEIVHRFNVAMTDINKKLARQSTSREQRERYVENLEKKLADLRERYDMREQHFKQQLHRKHLEERLAIAKKREVLRKHESTAKQLAELRLQLASAREEHTQLTEKLHCFQRCIRDGIRLLTETQELFERQSEEIAEGQSETKSLQTSNATVRNTNNSTNVHINAMEAECSRLQGAIADSRQVERRERAKVDALEKLCRQVTCERSELHSEILVMQDAWTNLKQEIEALKDQVGDSGKVFDVLQSIMNRESLDVAVSSIIKSGKTIEDVINDELSQLRLASGGKLDEKKPHAASAKSGATRSVEPPG